MKDMDNTIKINEIFINLMKKVDSKVDMPTISECGNYIFATIKNKENKFRVVCDDTFRSDYYMERSLLKYSLFGYKIWGCWCTISNNPDPFSNGEHKSPKKAVKSIIKFINHFSS